MFVIFLIFWIGLRIVAQQNHFPYDVKIRDIGRERISSKAIFNNGKPVIIEFWTTTCAPCITLLDSYHKVYAEWQKKYGVKIVAVSIDPSYRYKKIKELIMEKGWEFEFYMDPEKKLYKKMYSGNVIPITFVLNGAMQVQEKFHGIKPNFAYCIDSKTNELMKVRLNTDSKYANLDCDLTQYEMVLENIINVKR